MLIQGWGKVCKGTEGTYQRLSPGRVTWPGWTECLRLQAGCRWQEDNDPPKRKTGNMVWKCVLLVVKYKDAHAFFLYGAMVPSTG